MGLFGEFKRGKFEIKPFGKIAKEDIVEIEKSLMLFSQMITNNYYYDDLYCFDSSNDDSNVYLIANTFDEFWKLLSK